MEYSLWIHIFFPHGQPGLQEAWGWGRWDEMLSSKPFLTRMSFHKKHSQAIFSQTNAALPMLDLDVFPQKKLTLHVFSQTNAWPEYLSTDVALQFPHGQKVPKEPGNEERKWDESKLQIWPSLRGPLVEILSLDFVDILYNHLFLLSSVWANCKNWRVLPEIPLLNLPSFSFFLPSWNKWRFCICASH